MDPRLARDVREVVHDAVELRLRGVFAPVPVPLVLLAGVLELVSLGAGFTWMASVFVDPQSAGVLGLAAAAVVAGITVAISITSTAGPPRALRIRVGVHRVEIGPRFAIARAEIERARVEQGALVVRARDGRSWRFALPRRSEATWRALEALLAPDRPGGGQAPPELQRLRHPVRE